ncbi:DUF3471 domain-containing protein, partial [Flavobacterium sp.]|uniref:DUF3471 domain-containing protein n=1 Tax=Flavobacterium sp. TaxID=239 RepID=UPI00378DDE8B
IYSNVNDLSKWIIMQLQNGKYGSEKQNQLFTVKQQNEMWQLQTIIPSTAKAPYNTHFSGYGLGWFLSDIKGYKQVTHTGGLEGIVTQTTLFPELNLGIVVLTNQQSGAAFSAITNTIKDAYLTIPYTDYVELYRKREKENVSEADKKTEDVWLTIAKNQTDKLKIDLKKFTGIYKDNWFGEIEISEKKGKLFFKSLRSPKLAGEVFFYKDTIFTVKWNNRSFNADAFLFFELDNNKKPSALKMKPISELTDFSYDFQDLNFTRINE